MTRVKRGNVAQKRRKKVLSITEGFQGSSSRLFRTANQQKMKALQYSYRDRQQRKRNFRLLWITRLNGAVRIHRISYSKFINLLKMSKMLINRKILAQLAVYDQQAFNQLIQNI
jgi:large subunit ribosomal protein L20